MLPTADPVLTIRNIEKHFDSPEHGTVKVLKPLNLEVKAGTFLSITGPSGCGKSTLLQLIAGLDTPSSGELNIKSPDISFVFQRPLLFPWKNVLENVCFSAECQGKSGPKINAEARALLEKMGLSEFLLFRPHQLSQGMQQRVNLARALLTKPKILLMDEPFSALDIDTRMAMHQELLSRWREEQCTVIFVSHSLDEVVSLSDRVVMLSARPATIIHDVEINIPHPRGCSTEDKIELLRLVEQLDAHFPRQ